MLAGLSELDVGGPPQPPPQAAPQQQSLFDDPFGGPPAPAATPPSPQLPVLLSADKGRGLTLAGRLIRQTGQTGTSAVLKHDSAHQQTCISSMHVMRQSVHEPRLSSALNESFSVLVTHMKSCSLASQR